MEGAETTKDVFHVDGVEGNLGNADFIRDFEDGTNIIKVEGDIDIFWHVETLNEGQSSESKRTILRSSDSDSGDNIIAIIDGFDAGAEDVTFDDNDFAGGTIQEIT